MAGDNAFDIGVLTARLEATCNAVDALRAQVELLTTTTAAVKEELATYTMAGKLLKKVALGLAAVWVLLKTGDMTLVKSFLSGT